MFDMHHTTDQEGDKADWRLPLILEMLSLTFIERQFQGISKLFYTSQSTVFTYIKYTTLPLERNIQRKI
jgi:hypothetical protein